MKKLVSIILVLCVLSLSNVYGLEDLEKGEKIKIGNQIYDLYIDNYDRVSKTFIFDYNETRVLNDYFKKYIDTDEDYFWIGIENIDFKILDNSDIDLIGMKQITEDIIHYISSEKELLYGLQIFNAPIQSDYYSSVCWSNYSRIIPYGNRIGLMKPVNPHRSLLHELGHNIAEQMILYNEPNQEEVLKNWTNNKWEGYAEAYVKYNGYLRGIYSRNDVLNKINQLEYKNKLKELRESRVNKEIGYPVLIEIKSENHQMIINNSDIVETIYSNDSSISLIINGVNLEKIVVYQDGVILNSVEQGISEFDKDLEYQKYNMNKIENTEISIKMGYEEIQKFQLG